MKTLADIFGVKIEKDMVKKRPMRVEDIDCSSRLEKYFKEHNSKVKHGNNKMREEFEKLPSVAKYLPYVFFNNETQGYCNKSDNVVPLDFSSFLNGAYYAFQEQQKKIDAIKAIAEKWENTEYTYNSDSTDTKIEQMRICGRKIIDELLK